MSGIPFGAGSRTTPEYVKFNPSDSGFGLAPVFWKREDSLLSPPPLDPTLTERTNQTRSDLRRI